MKERKEIDYGFHRFETARFALSDCYDHINDNEENLSIDEQEERTKLIEICQKIVDRIGKKP